MEPKCGKCAGKMQAGFVIDQEYGRTNQEKWAGGKPEPMQWLGIDFGVKVKAGSLMAVTTYRCMACGFLESYARG